MVVMLIILVVAASAAVDIVVCYLLLFGVSCWSSICWLGTDEEEK